MSELAIRKSDKQVVKIGTCESMYYLRYEDRNKVERHANSLNPHSCKNLFWRFPVFTEDDIKVGDYEHYEVSWEYDVMVNNSAEAFQELKDCTGNVQAKIEELGILVNLPCYHGLKLPENTEDISFFFNGKRDGLMLYALKNTEKELRIVIRCAACRSMWSFPYNEIDSAILSDRMRARLFFQCAKYWDENNEEELCPYRLWYKLPDKRVVSYSHTDYGWERSIETKDGWIKDPNDIKICSWIESLEAEFCELIENKEV